MKKNTECGTILPKKSMILRRFVGEAANGALKYEMSTSMSGNPIIRSRKTGKWFSLSWADILNLAETAGIND